LGGGTGEGGGKGRGQFLRDLERGSREKRNVVRNWGARRRKAEPPTLLTFSRKEKKMGASPYRGKLGKELNGPPREQKTRGFILASLKEP